MNRDHLPNELLTYRAFENRLQVELDEAGRGRQDLTVVCIDPDDFTRVNHEHGTDTADRILHVLVQRLLDHLDDACNVGEVFGDRFVFTLNNRPDSDDVQDLLTTLPTALHRPIVVDDVEVSLTISLGLAGASADDELSPAELVSRADQACTQAELSGGNQTHYFDVDLDLIRRQHRELLEQVRVALEQDHFALHYQPLIELASGALVGVEALVRWNHPTRGLLMPNAFLTAIAGDELQRALGRWVIDEAIGQLAAWGEDGLSTIVSVNLTAEELGDAAFVSWVIDTITEHPTVEPHHLRLELVESSELTDLAALEAQVVRLADLGMRVALDDFGKAGSNLDRLQQLSVSTIKVDRSFVHNLPTSSVDVAVVRLSIGLAKHFDVTVLAEGVESDAHRRILLELGCDYAQGYGIARPMPADELPGWAQQWHTATR